MSRINGYGPSLIVLATTVVVLLAGPVAVRQITFRHTQAKIIQASQRLEQNQILEQINQASHDVATIVEPAVVHISTEHLIRDQFGNQGRKASSGSGWIFDETGHIVTNHHVVEDAVRIEVQLYDGVIRDASVVGSDPTTDIAVLKIPPGELHAATRRDPQNEPVRQGDMVFAFGSPFDFRFSMSSGIVSGKGRSVGVIRDSYGQRIGYENFIQVDAAINPGNSGGPLTDFRGRVIGMNTAIATGRRGQSNFDDGQFAGIGLAIPIEMIAPVVIQLIENGGVVAKGYLGVQVVDAAYRLRDETELLRIPGAAVIVGHIPPDHPAAEAGLQYFDLITHVDDQRVTSVGQFDELTLEVPLAGVLELSLLRWDARADQLVRERVALPSSVARRMGGVSMLQMSNTVGEALEVIGFRGRGVRVGRAEPDGPAHAAGVERGDVVTHVNDQPLGSVQQLRSVISSMMPGETATLTIWRYDPSTDEARTLEVKVALARLDMLGVYGRLPGDHSLEQIVELGIKRMTTSTRRLAREWEVDYHPGVMITELVRGSDLESRIKPGSTIVEVMQAPVSDVQEFINALQQYNLRVPGVRVTVMLPDGQSKQIVLRVQPEQP